MPPSSESGAHQLGPRCVLSLLQPFLLSAAALVVTIVAAHLSPPTSAFHTVVILCGTRAGYLFALLLLTWAIFVIRRTFLVVRCLCRRLAGKVVRRHAPWRKREYRAVAAAPSPSAAVAEGCGALEDDFSGDGSEDDISDQCSHTEREAKHSRAIILYDCAAIGTLYVALCFLAWWCWAPPTFDPSIFTDNPGNSSLDVLPPTFLFGAATSSYQVEGNIFNNQWAEFEDDPAGRRIREGQRCGSAADVWNRFDSDLEERIAGGLGLGAYRFSVEWARIEPRRGVFDDEALDRYASWASKLRGRGVEPVVTLHHFTDPIWFERLGAFENAASPDLLVPYARKVAERLGPYVDRWITINEPMVYAGNGYLMGEFPPARSGDFGAMLGVVGNMLAAHENIYHAIKNIQPRAKISIAKNTILYWPWSYADLFAVVGAAVSDVYYNAMPMRVLQRQKSLDWIGLNTYIRMQVGFGGSSLGFVFPPERQSDMGWDLEPQVLYSVVKQYHSYLPELEIVITEHGVADGQNPDTRRVAFMHDSLLGLAFAINHEHIPISGYFHWSLLDNWEWSSGYLPKFGLYHIDLPENQVRSLTKGGEYYREVIYNRKILV